METEDLVEHYVNTEFPEEAVSEMAGTFDSRQSELVSAGAGDEATAQQASIELFQEWKRVCQRHGVEGEADRKALILSGMAQYIEDSKRKNIALMASRLTEM